MREAHRRFGPHAPRSAPDRCIAQPARALRGGVLGRQLTCLWSCGRDRTRAARLLTTQLWPPIPTQACAAGAGTRTQYLSTDTAKCVKCSPACKGCSGPTARDCKVCLFGSAKFGACAMSQQQYDIAAKGGVLTRPQKKTKAWCDAHAGCSVYQEADRTSKCAADPCKKSDAAMCCKAKPGAMCNDRSVTKTFQEGSTVIHLGGTVESAIWGDVDSVAVPAANKGKTKDVKAWVQNLVDAGGVFELSNGSMGVRVSSSARPFLCQSLPLSVSSSFFPSLIAHTLSIRACRAKCVCERRGAMEAH